MNHDYKNFPNKPESVWDYPRPPALEVVSERIRIEFCGVPIADSLNAKRILETSHPPVYYLPLSDIKPGVLKPRPGTSWCEWKGRASYYDVALEDCVAKKAAWFYPNPSPAFQDIANYVAFYADKMDACYIGDERVEAQPGSFYGGWITSNIVGPFKGGKGTIGW